MKLTEGLDYHDMKGQIDPKITVDEYAAKMGEDSDIVTVTFTVNSKLAAQDLVAWLEIGYDYILDASVSDGEIQPGKWLVFVEMKRRSTVPERIVAILDDLETLTDRNTKDYLIKVNDDYYEPNTDTLKEVMILSPREYKNDEEDSEGELNEMREIAGLKHKTVHNVDEELRKYIANAGL